MQSRCNYLKVIVHQLERLYGSFSENKRNLYNLNLWLISIIKIYDSRPPHPLSPRSAPSFGYVEIRASSIIIVGFTVCGVRGVVWPAMLPTSTSADVSFSSTNSAAAATTTTPVSTALGYTAELLRDQPSPTQPSDYCCAIINDRLIKWIKIC